MTALAFILGFITIGAIYIGILYLLSKKSAEENRINSQQETIDDQKIRADVHALSDDDIKKIVSSRGITKKP